MNRHRAYWSNMSDHPNPKRAEIDNKAISEYEGMKKQVEALINRHGFYLVTKAVRDIHEAGGYYEGKPL